MSASFNSAVSTRYHMYNSLFLNLPFQGIYRTGTLLPLLQRSCEEGYEKGLAPQDIIRQFFDEYLPSATQEERENLLFNFIQYIERQIVLFDAIEDASFDKINDLQGKGTVAALLARAAAEHKEAELVDKLRDFSVRIVLTAHPTQFYPGNVLAIIHDLEGAIEDNRLEHINLLLWQLGKTAFINKVKPSPFEEAVSLSWYLEYVFYSVIPQIIQKLLLGLEQDPASWSNYDLIKIGFWPGGDRDGNPNVNAATTIQVADYLQQRIFKCYYRDIKVLRRRLTFKGIEDRIARIEEKIYPAAFGREGDRHISKDHLLKDLTEIRSALIRDHEGLFLDQLDAFILKVKLFGFYFASMDVRQDSRKHRLAWEALFEQQGRLAEYQATGESERIRMVLGFQDNVKETSLDDDFLQDLIDSFKAIAAIQAKNGIESCHRYVISNCGSALDVILVYQLGRLLIGARDLAFDVIPLFETVEDLSAAAEIMSTLYGIPEYRAHLETRDNAQTIMLGFSDGTKDGGYLRANWSIFRAKEDLTRITRESGLKAIFFDGRGGPPARGGGNTHDFYASLGHRIENKEVQITIQGQTISSNFGNHDSCLYNVEQLLSAGIVNSVFKNGHDLSESDHALMDELAQAGHTSYLALKEDPKFVPYLEQVTPLPYFGDANIGSRPVKRNSDDQGLRFEDLRAIPFVGSWAQIKQNIPGFYGVGSALQKLVETGKEAELKALFRKSMFFRTLLNNSMMSLTKTYYPATAYLEKDPEFKGLWKKMYSEYLLSCKMLLGISGQEQLMQGNPINRDSVLFREKIVLPLVTIQQYALQQLQHADNRDQPRYQVYKKMVIRCMFGIINAARNSA